MHFTKRHHASKINIFSEIQQYANRYDTIDLSQNSSDEDLPDPLKKYLREATEINFAKFNSQFALPLLIENLIHFNAKRKLPIHLNEEEITVVPGATYATYVALATVVDPGDEVIILTPCYDTYIPVIEMLHGKAIEVELSKDFEVDWDILSSAIGPKTKAIIVNSPHNPTGNIWNKEDWNQLNSIIKDSSIIVVADEVYDAIVYDNYVYYSAMIHPELKHRTFCIHSLDKTLYLTGWKIGYITAEKKLNDAFKDIHQYLCFTANFMAQYAVANYLMDFDIEKNASYFQTKRDLLLSEFGRLPIKPIAKSKGTYTQTFDFKNHTNGLSDKEFAIKMIKEAGVAMIPYSGFYPNGKNTGMMRASFGKKPSTIEEAAQRLEKFL